jgi:hypothetical protein
VASPPKNFFDGNQKGSNEDERDENCQLRSQNFKREKDRKATTQAPLIADLPTTNQIFQTQKPFLF